MISSPMGIERLGAPAPMVLSSTSPFGGVEMPLSFEEGVNPEFGPEGLLPWVSEGEELEDIGYCRTTGDGVGGTKESNSGTSMNDGLYGYMADPCRKHT